MSRKCSLTGKKLMSGNNVSHSNHKIRRKFLPNTQKFSLFSTILDRLVTIRLATSTARTIEQNNGLDEYLMSIPSSNMSKDALRLKQEILVKKCQMNDVNKEER